jgi:hypothetical protein
MHYSARPGDGGARRLTRNSPHVRVAGALVLAGVAGFLLGACGGGGGASSALSTRTGLTATRSQPTVAQPTAPVTAEATPTVATTTVEVTTTAPRPTTPTPTRPQLTVTLTATTSTVAATTTAPTTPAVTPTTTTSEPASSSETPWGWIALVLALTGLAVLGILLWGRRRSRRVSQSAHLADLRRRTLITLDDVVAQGSVVAGQVEALAAEARDLERHAPGDEATAAVAPVRAALDELAEALDADRTLRLATPPPSADQLAYSDALIRRQVTQLQEALRSP